MQRIEELPIQQLISQLCPVMLNLRQASASPSSRPVSISSVRRCPMISSTAYRFRAMRPLLLSAGILTPAPTWFIGGGSDLANVNEREVDQFRYIESRF